MVVHIFGTHSKQPHNSVGTMNPSTRLVASRRYKTRAAGGKRTATSLLATTSCVAAQVLTNTDMKNKRLTITSTFEYAALPLELGLATSALIVSAKKLEKNIKRHPFFLVKADN